MKKDYLIPLFIKKATLYLSIQTSISKTIEMITSSLPNIGEKELDILKKRYTIDEYIKRLTPIIDEFFSKEDLEQAIAFYTKGAGRKIFDPSFLKRIEKMEKDIFLEMERDFLEANAGHKKT